VYCVLKAFKKDNLYILMFGRIDDGCNHSKNGVCSKCVLRSTFNLSTESTDKSQTITSSLPQNNTTTILSFDELLLLEETTSPRMLPKFLPSSESQVCMWITTVFI
jgi:hypothetical protein